MSFSNTSVNTTYMKCCGANCFGHMYKYLFVARVQLFTCRLRLYVVQQCVVRGVAHLDHRKKTCVVMHRSTYSRSSALSRVQRAILMA